MHTIQFIEVVWTIIALLMMVFSGRLATRGWRMLRAAKSRGITDARREVVRGFLVRGTIKVAISLVALGAGINAMRLPEPPGGSLTPGTLVLVTIELLVMLLVGYDEFVHLQIVRELDASGYLDLDHTPPLEPE